MKKNATDLTVLLETLASMQEEKARLSHLVESLREENRVLAESYKGEIAAMREDNKKLADSRSIEMDVLRETLEESHRNETASLRLTIETLKKTVDDVRNGMDEMAKANKSLSAQLADVMASGKLARGKRFAPSTEQRDMLNNRDTDRRGEDKDNFDGIPLSGEPC